MTAPTPDTLAHTIARIIDTLASGVEVGEGRARNDGGTWHKQSVADAYRWLHQAAYATRSGGHATSTLCRTCEGYGWVYDNGTARRCETCTPRMLTDPTGDTVANQAALRDELAEVGRLSEQALASVAGMVTAIATAVGTIDRGASRELPHERSIPRTATRGEVEAARAAQRRRQERGEGFGSE